MTLNASHSHNYRPHPKDGGRYCFQFVCQFTSRGGVPQSGLGGYPIPDLAGGGTPSQVWLGGYPIPGLAGGGQGQVRMG